MLNDFQNVTPKENQAPFLICLSPKETLFQGKLSLVANKQIKGTNKIIALYYTPGIAPGAYSGSIIYRDCDER